MSNAYAREPEAKKGMDSSQITGAASSYARKYALNGLFAIDDTKDADTKPPEDNEPLKEGKPDKEWYNSFEKDKARMIDRIKSGGTALAIIASIQDEGFRISKAIQDQIKALG